MSRDSLGPLARGGKAAAARLKRREMRAAMPDVRLEARHVAGSALLPDREALLAVLPRGGDGAECGVAAGAFSRQIVDIAAPRRLHLIDAWQAARYESERAKVEKRMAAEIADGTVMLHQGLSTEVMATFEDASLDWIYIDTDHSYATTAAELREADRLLRPDGLVLGHDFCVGNIVKPTVYGVIQAVNAFCVEAGWRYAFQTLETHGHFSFCLRRLAD